MLNTICENCSGVHDGSYASGRFCSVECSRGFSTKAKRLEINAKISAKTKGRPSARVYVTGYKRSPETVAKMRGAYKQRLTPKSFEESSQHEKKKRILAEQDFKCRRCGISDWQGEQITLELEHIDGNNKNDLRDNLECLCPNCHSLTSTWRTARGTIPNQGGKSP